jgi:group I intron endonuclease
MLDNFGKECYGCIYKILSLIDNKVYIGQTKNFEKRKDSHTKQLNKNQHGNAHLQYAWNKYGQENFIFEIIDYCYVFEKQVIIDLEYKWKVHYNVWNPNFGYNIAVKDNGGDTLSNHPRKKEIRKQCVETFKKNYKKEQHHSYIFFEKETIDKIINLYNNFYTVKEIEKIINITGIRIYNILKENNIKLHKRGDYDNTSKIYRNLSEEQKLNIVNLYLQEYSILELTRIYYPNSVIIKILKEFNITLRKQKRTARSKQKEKTTRELKSEEEKQITSKKMSLAHKGKIAEKVKCPYCNKIGGKSSMHVWHFEKCKFKDN